MQKRTRKHVRYILVERGDRVLIFHDHGVPLETFILPKALYTHRNTFLRYLHDDFPLMPPPFPVDRCAAWL